MDRQTRREYFERICERRDSYARLGPADTTSVITIEAMIARASRMLVQPVDRPTVVRDADPATN